MLQLGNPVLGYLILEGQLLVKFHRRSFLLYLSELFHDIPQLMLVATDLLLEEVALFHEIVFLAFLLALPIEHICSFLFQLHLHLVAHVLQELQLLILSVCFLVVLVTEFLHGRSESIVELSCQPIFLVGVIILQ